MRLPEKKEELQEACQQAAVCGAVHRYPNMRGAASGHVDGCTVFVFHLFELDGAVATGVDDFNHVAHRKFVLGFHLGPAVSDSPYLTDKLAAVPDRVTGFIVLVIVGRAAVQ